MKNEGITVAPVHPSSVTGSVLTLGIAGGKIDQDTFAGTLNHTGGLKFTRGNTTVTLTDLVLNTQTKQVTGAVNGNSLPIFDLNLASLKHAREPRHTVIGTSIFLAMTPEAANALNTGLGVTSFKSGQKFGVATVAVAVKS
jgi:hypothetical protein